MAKTVRALRTGFYGGARRREGTTFEISDEHQLGAWMQEVKDQPVKKETPKPTTAGSYEELLEKAKGLGLTFSGRPKKDVLLEQIAEAESIAKGGSLV